MSPGMSGLAKTLFKNAHHVLGTSAASQSRMIKCRVTKPQDVVIRRREREGKKEKEECAHDEGAKMLSVVEKPVQLELFEYNQQSTFTRTYRLMP